MKTILGNLNWLLLTLILGTSIISISNLEGRRLIFNLGLLLLLGFFGFYTTLKAAKINLSLKIEQHRLKNVIKDLHDGVIAYDENFKILIFNPSAEQIFNLKADDILGHSLTLKARQEATPEMKTLLTVLFPALAPMIIRRSDPGAYPHVIDISLDQPPLDLRIATTKILDEENKTLGYVKLIHDRTRELSLLRSKSEFITVASHQLRTPLTAIRWSLESLNKIPLDGEAKDFVTSGVSAVNQLLRIVNDLLDVARIEEGKFGYQFQEINIVDFLEEALRQAQGVAKQYKVKIYFEKPAEEAIMATVDPQKLALVLTNLLDNSVKYNIPNGEIIVKVERLGKNPFIQITIKDTGVGIPEQALDKIFTKFFRAENAAKTAPEGTGLGLYISKNIIKSHGGQIWVASTLNRGTTVYFTLPTNQTLIPAKEMVHEEEI